MKLSIKKGFGFGVTSGVITTLGLIVGLNSSTGSVLVVTGGIMIIAIADAMSDALGIHVSEEFENVHKDKEIWAATIMTFLSKFVFAAIFIIPFLLFSLSMAIKISIVGGLSVIVIFSYLMAKSYQKNPIKVVFEHLLIAELVIIFTHCIGDWVSVYI